MPYGTACHRLRKLVLFDLLKRHNENVCYRCGQAIELIDELTMEHKKPWENEDAQLFWSLNNIAFSHEFCNYRAKRYTGARAEHGTPSRYRAGCRCDLCRAAASAARLEQFHIHGRPSRRKVLATPEEAG